MQLVGIALNALGVLGWHLKADAMDGDYDRDHVLAPCNSPPRMRFVIGV